MSDISGAGAQALGPEPCPPRELWPYKAWGYFGVLLVVWYGSYKFFQRAYFSTGWFSQPLDDPYTWLAYGVAAALLVSTFIVYLVVMAEVEEQDLVNRRAYHMERLRWEELRLRAADSVTIGQMQEEAYEKWKRMYEVARQLEDD